MWPIWLFIAGALHSVAGRSRPCGIIEGNPIDIHHVPYMVSLRSNNGHFCGGSIVDKRFILTAAHCFDPSNKIVAVVGSTRLDERGDRYTIDKVFIHPNYSVYTFENDAAMMRVSKPIVFKETVQKIKLTDKKKKLKRGNILTVSGWGKTAITKTAGPSNDLMTVEVPFIESATCQNVTNFSITKRMICAGENHHGVCSGDSGGALVYRDLDRDEQVGITSFGKTDCDGPGVFTRVSSIVDWISKTIRRNKF